MSYLLMIVTNGPLKNFLYNTQVVVSSSACVQDVYMTSVTRLSDQYNDVVSSMSTSSHLRLHVNYRHECDIEQLSQQQLFIPDVHSNIDMFLTELRRPLDEAQEKMEDVIRSYNEIGNLHLLSLIVGYY